ncbi:MAG: prepilin-type N-terminal cleavage/methylation domain-containing protein [Phycisphaerales bacterium]
MGLFSRRAFTLVELVIVVAAAALLTAIVAPAIGRARSVALADKEKAAARLTHKSWAMYAEDNREKLLPASGHWDWIHPLSPPGPNTPRLQPNDPFMAGRIVEGTAAKFWTPFLMSQVPMRTDQIQVDAATRTAFDARNPTPTSISGNFTSYSSNNRLSAYIMHPSVGMNGVYVGGSYAHGAFRASPTTGPNPVQSGGRFYVTSMSDVRTPASLMVFASSRGSDVINSGDFFSYGANNPDFGTTRPGYWLVTPPRAHPRGRGGAFTPTSLGGTWGSTTNNTFDPLRVPSYWGMLDVRSSGAVMTIMIDGHSEAQTLEQLRDMRKWSNYATSATWNFVPGP